MKSKNVWGERLQPPFSAAGAHIGCELPGGRVLFTTRRGGVSGAPFDTLNLGLRPIDYPPAVAANRERVGALTGIPHERTLRGMQVHGRTCAASASRRRQTAAGAVRRPGDRAGRRRRARADRRLPAGRAGRPRGRGDRARRLARTRRRRAGRGRRALRELGADATSTPRSVPAPASAAMRPGTRCTRRSRPTPQAPRGAPRRPQARRAPPARAGEAPARSPTSACARSARPQPVPLPSARLGGHPTPAARRASSGASPTRARRACRSVDLSAERVRRTSPTCTSASPPRRRARARRGRRRARRRGQVRRRSRSSARSREAGVDDRRREPRAGPAGEGRRATATRSDGTSSATCRAARSSRSRRSCA